MTTKLVPLARPKTPKAMRFNILKRIGRRPEISSSKLIDDIIRKDARDVVFFWSSPVYLTMTLEDQMRVYQAKSPAEADRIFKKCVRDRSGEYAVNPAIITRTKTWLNKNHAAKGNPDDAVYGASGLGYVLQMHMNANRSARWLYPRLKQQQHEMIAANHCVDIIEQQADSHERTVVATLLRTHANMSFQHKRLKNINKGLKAHYLQNRS